MTDTTTHTHTDTDPAEEVEAVLLAALDPDGAFEQTLADIRAEAADRWHITDEGMAEWALTRYRAILERAERQTAPAAVAAAALEARAAEIRASIDRAKTAAEHDAAFLKAALQDYMRRRRTEDPRCKSLTLGSGRLTSTKGQDKVDYDPDKAMKLVAADEDGVYSRLEPKINKTALRKHILARHAELVAAAEKAGDPAPPVDDALPAGAVWLPATEDDVTYDVKL